MWSTILPELVAITAFTLTLLCIDAGRNPGYLQDYAILSINTTNLKNSYHANSSAGLPIHDSYSMFMQTECSGYYSAGNVLPLQDVTCSVPSVNAKFAPGELIMRDLLAHGSSANLTSLLFPKEIDRQFNEHYNIQLHVALVFYIIALIILGMTIVWGIVSFFMGALALLNSVLTIGAINALFIASVLATVTQTQAAAFINDYGAPNVTAGYGHGFLKLTWAAFALSFVNEIIWVAAASISLTYRDY